MKQFALTCFLAFVLSAIFPASGREWGGFVVAGGDDKVLIIDTGASRADSAAVVWRWEISDAQGEIPEKYQDLCIRVDDCKPVKKGRQLLVTASSNSTLLLDIKTGKCLFWAETPMAHSAEMLPGNRVVVANSENPAGNSLELYDVSKPEKLLFRDSLYFAHGTVWMPKQKRLYALGYQEIRSYKLKDWKSDAPSLELERVYPVPTDGGHDLSRVNQNELMVTTRRDVYLFDVNTGTFTVFEPLQGVKSVKSVNYNKKSGQIIYTKAEEYWWTHHLYSMNPEWSIEINNINLYKVRPL